MNSSSETMPFLLFPCENTSTQPSEKAKKLLRQNKVIQILPGNCISKTKHNRLNFTLE